MTISSVWLRIPARKALILECRIALRIKHPYEEQAMAYRIYKLRDKEVKGGRSWNFATQEQII